MSGTFWSAEGARRAKHMDVLRTIPPPPPHVRMGIMRKLICGIATHYNNPSQTFTFQLEFIMIAILSPSVPEHYEYIAQLMNEFHQWCCARYSGERSWEFHDYFNEKAWAHELSKLDEIYLPPDGEFLLATYDSEPVGCVALKKFTDSMCEIKRLYVRANFRGKGIARKLMSAILDKARKYDYQYARLEFGELFTESNALYKSIGFKNIDAYTDIPERLKPKMVFMELKL